MKIFESYNELMESKQTEVQATGVLKRGGVEDFDDVLGSLKGVDKSNNQKNLPFMAWFYLNGGDQLNDLSSVFDEYEVLLNKKRVKPLQYGKKAGMSQGEKMYDNFLSFVEYIHGETNKYTEKPKGGSVDAYEADDKPLWSGNNIDIYDGNDVGKCIKYTQGGLTGRGYSFCIGQPANTMYQSYRDSKVSTFYFIVDRNRFKTNDDGSVNLDDPLHIVVFDMTEHGIELTDADNNTGNIAEYGEDTQGYVNYLKSKGVPVEKMGNKAKTPEEETEQELLGRKNDDLDWFKKLSIEQKSKYIGRGHLLTDKQFDYLLGV